MIGLAEERAERRAEILGRRAEARVRARIVKREARRAVVRARVVAAYQAEKAIGKIAEGLGITRTWVWENLAEAAERGEVVLRHRRPRGFNAQCVELMQEGMTTGEIAVFLGAPARNVTVALSKWRRRARTT